MFAKISHIICTFCKTVYVNLPYFYPPDPCPMAVIVGDDVRRWKLLHPFAAIATPLCRNCCAPMLQLLGPDVKNISYRCILRSIGRNLHSICRNLHSKGWNIKHIAPALQPALYGAIRPSDETKKMLTPVIIMFFFINN